ncbi:hypothetical protein COV24_03795 [candidate division WWE3 bacterium CG10_big_fil_rev_8_21_14_0_10_32_10]|uniref:Uncharacterized protein n=1 Tax=candidate division WWE3 bacterium CG10_big_fil_rev_8_21_14_0_10_32_10 TaxID=1975090 RepID=A0A2H0RBQ4_UNCKA|nr:MAG: hypothetical protein COV24_03795 [candidate division WWE3 bacterium CG10_big_fil_rev_8_21_14_0_10_32_10]
MENLEKNFTKDLQESKNIAIIADSTKRLDSLCASIGLSELIKTFLGKKSSYVVSVYFLGALPLGFDVIKKQVKVFNKIGEKTLYIRFPADNVEKVQYDFDEIKKEFNLGLVGYTYSDKCNVTFDEIFEKFDMAVGVGFKDNKDFVNKVPYIKKIPQFIFNKNNLDGSSLVEGVIDLFFKENVKPSKKASLSFFTFLSRSEKKST